MLLFILAPATPFTPPVPEGDLSPHRGRGWGHNVGLCLATARFRAMNGATAEQILAEAFPASWRTP